ncbi:MAG: AzlC family ABC transporter permease [Firmicutes bacterium]|nr:AzlC family ABC transporter permease [Bacillota bacterium]
MGKQHIERKSSFAAAFRAAFPYSMPVLAGFMVLGIAYGILMADKGYGFPWAVLMSAVCFCGSMQFVAITLLTTAFDPLAALLLSFMVNARHLFYGLSLMDRYRGQGALRFPLIYLLCDETFSINCSVEPPEQVDKGYFYLSISLLHYGYWVTATLIGSLLGSLLTFDTTGMDFALTALFVVLFIEQIRPKENRLSGFIGLACTMLALVLFGADNLVVPAMAMILLVLVVGRKRLCT